MTELHCLGWFSIGYDLTPHRLQCCNQALNSNYYFHCRKLINLRTSYLTGKSGARILDAFNFYDRLLRRQRLLDRSCIQYAWACIKWVVLRVRAYCLESDGKKKGETTSSLGSKIKRYVDHDISYKCTTRPTPKTRYPCQSTIITITIFVAVFWRRCYSGPSLTQSYLARICPCIENTSKICCCEVAIYSDTVWNGILSCIASINLVWKARAWRVLGSRGWHELENDAQCICAVICRWLSVVHSISWKRGGLSFEPWKPRGKQMHPYWSSSSCQAQAWPTTDDFHFLLFFPSFTLLDIVHSPLWNSTQWHPPRTELPTVTFRTPA